MIKRLLKKLFSREAICIVIALTIMVLTLFCASQHNITQESGILDGLLAFVLIMLFFSSTMFLCFMIAPINDESQNEKKES